MDMSRTEEILCEFEMFYRRLTQFLPHSKDAAMQCHTSLQSLAHEYANKTPDVKIFSLGREHMKTLKDLRMNSDVIITRPDKGRATVVMNRSDNIDKILTILEDPSKFEELGHTSSYDKTAGVEASLNKFLGELRDNREITNELF